MSETNVEYKPREKVIDFIIEMVRVGMFSIKVEEGEPPMTIDILISEIRKGTTYGENLYAIGEVIYENELANGLYYSNLANTPYYPEDLVFS